MITISKPVIIPEILTIQGAAQNLLNMQAYDNDPILYISGPSKISIDTAIYNGKDVKKILKIAQYNKCCFCEKNQKDEYGDVEHFRPKEAIKIAKGTPVMKPGYYWLGYTWDNLFFVCGPCNKKKSMYFPLEDEARRVRSHHGNIALESPLIVNPSGPDDPRIHIQFKQDVAIGLTAKGKSTIVICDLNRSSLMEDRKILLENIEFTIEVLRKINDPTDALFREGKSRLKRWMNKRSPFSSTATDHILKSRVLNIF